MSNLIITSEQRVGSRWMHYLFADLLNSGVSPEIDGQRLFDNYEDTQYRVKDILDRRDIVKFHSADPITIKRFLSTIHYQHVPILGVVRNPYDRAVSFALHKRQASGTHQGNVDTDEEAVIWTATEDEGFIKSNYEQMGLMMSYHSTLLQGPLEYKYVWTTYEWLKEDTEREVRRICRRLYLLDNEEDYGIIPDVVRSHSFEMRSGRKPGDEERSNRWRRKGIVGDYKNWFNKDCYESLEKIQYRYKQAVANEEHNLQTAVFV